MEEFIKELSIETHLSYKNAKLLVGYINSKVGNLETAHKLYSTDGVRGLEIYAQQLKLGIKF
ncbi:hypothetical protein K8O96_12030 [Clostridium sporogenes]|uniref:Uncharacterized protein n=1 Tax=Clostridium botulinum TaxID=1491 RepID=A0A6M0SVA6_CLOBO|nr:hypothetical protein [Clostridium sporogenes]NFA59478.1 hypothetical protein [Clostridium botulinum]NFI74662.1 hypothetical protein [Clostridium sporogenes]NFL71203.1 hypothetical protein [Clostridium sporogenes]NFM26118.1 hypothetical protein [Clostridium sporogenes]NFP62476.1 hypothetical protein [Clostridium sporogenes]